MKAVEFNVTVPGYLLTKGLGGVTDSVVHGGPSGLNLVDRPAPTLPGDDWVRLEVLLAGICGSDLGNLSFRSSPAMEPFGSFPAVLGHEILARVTEVGSAVQGLSVGQRVVVDPMLHCETRGYKPDSWCPSCTSGLHGTCEMAGEEGPLQVDGKPLARGLTIGYHADLAGGWGEQMVAHKRQVFPVPDGLDDRVAVLTEPLAIGVHAVLGSRALNSDGPILVIGSGTIAFAAIWALRALGFEGPIHAQAKRPHEVELARRLGADATVTPGDQAREALIGTGAMAYMPIVGDEVYSGGGYKLIFDCVGSGQTIKQALRYGSPRSEIILLGCAAEIKKLDLTFVWARELNVKGFVGYGAEDPPGTEAPGEAVDVRAFGAGIGRPPHTFDITLDAMLARPELLEGMVTHVLPLAQYRDALRIASNHRKTGAVKVVLQP